MGRPGDWCVRCGRPRGAHASGGSTNGTIDATWALAGLIDDETIIIPGHGQLSTRTDLLEYRQMLVTIRDRMKAQIAEGLSADAVVASNPAQGFAQPGPGTERWLRAAYEEWRGGG